MEEITYVVKDKNGLHARPAGTIVNEAKKFKSEITVTKDGKEANGKRLLSLMGLGANCNSTLLIKIEGEDEKEAMQGIKEVLKNLSSED